MSKPTHVFLGLRDGKTLPVDDFHVDVDGTEYVLHVLAGDEVTKPVVVRALCLVFPLDEETMTPGDHYEVAVRLVPAAGRPHSHVEERMN